MNKEKLEEIKNLVKTGEEYQSFREDEKVKDKLHLLCVCGSYSYGTEREDSDIDLRGAVALDPCYTNGTLKDWEIRTFSETDTVIRSYRKMLHLMSEGDPDTLSLVGQNLDNYLYLSNLGKELVIYHSDFIGARGVYKSFIGFSNSQMRRLELAELGRLEEKPELKRELKGSILKNAIYNMSIKYPTIELENLNFEFDISENEEEPIKIKSVSGSDITIEDYFNVAKDIKSIINSFGKKGKRNEKKSDFKLNKHCMHTVRSMLMCIECLETGIVKTYRENDLPLLRKILNGEFMDADGKMGTEFYELVEDLRKKSEYAFKNSILPMEPDMKKVSDMMTEFVLYDLKKEP